jgi:hypothetical protein
MINVVVKECDRSGLAKSRGFFGSFTEASCQAKATALGAKNIKVVRMLAVAKPSACSEGNATVPRPALRQ